MCGLLGVLDFKKQLNTTQVQQLVSASELMYHRGPDSSGHWNDEHVAYSFNRLSFIDLEHSQQPLLWGPADNPQRYVLVFNGEIYNYRELREELAHLGATFTTQGDSETIPAAWHYWGHKAFTKLRGMFACAIWDTLEQTLILARDPFGIKPLFFAVTDQTILFSSEKKCITSLADEYSIDVSVPAQVVQEYTELQYVPETHTLSRGIEKLESGHYAIFSHASATVTSRQKATEAVHSPSTTRSVSEDGSLIIYQYFHPEFTHHNHTGDALYKDIADTLTESVEKHMRSDVTVGSFLSGGIDSTAIATLAKRYNPQLKTFTIGFDRGGYSEIDVAAQSAEAIGVEHISTVLSEEDYLNAVPQIVWYLDEPVADPSLVPLFFLAKLAREHVKVVLSGEGADELFGGYTIYKEPLSLQPFDFLPTFARKAVGRAAGFIPNGVRGKSLLERGSMTLEERYYGNARSFSTNQLKNTLTEYKTQWDHVHVTAPYYQRCQGLDPVSRMQYIDIYTWLRGDILVKADKMTMANSLELRVPFMDPQVYDVARTLTVEDKISHGTTKYALRKALELIVPSHVLHRPKLGFPVPIRHWLKEGIMQDWARNIVRNAHTDAFYNTEYVLSMLDEHHRGENDHSRRIWTVLVFMLWHQIFVEKTLQPHIDHRSYPERL